MKNPNILFINNNPAIKDYITQASIRCFGEHADSDEVLNLVDRSAQQGKIVDGSNFTLPPEEKKISFSIEFDGKFSFGMLSGASMNYNLSFSDMIQFAKKINDEMVKTGKSKESNREMIRDLIIDLFRQNRKIKYEHGKLIPFLVSYLIYYSQAKEPLVQLQNTKGVNHIGYIITQIGMKDFNFRLVIG